MREPMQNKAEITVNAVMEAVEFIEANFSEWEGDFQDFMASVISDDRVTSYDVKRLLNSLSEGEPIEGLDTLSAEKIGTNYKVNVNR
jgi:hypothetical protein